MKKTMTFQHEDSLLILFAKAVRKPLAMLAGYYSKVLETEINLRQTLLLLNAQLAFSLQYSLCAPSFSGLSASSGFVMH